MDSTGTPGASCRLAWRTQRALGSGAVLKPFSHGWTTPSNLPWSCTTPARSVGLNPATCAMTSLGWRPTRLTWSASATGNSVARSAASAPLRYTYFHAEVPLAVSLEFRGQTRNPVQPNAGFGDNGRRGEVMRLWQNNRLDGTFEEPTEQIVAQFRVSVWWTADLDLDSAVRGFLTDIDGPVNAVWDDEADLADICAQARAAGWSGAAGVRTAAVA